MNKQRKNDDDWTQTFTTLVEIQWATPQSKAQIRWASIKSSLNTRWNEGNERVLRKGTWETKNMLLGARTRAPPLDSNPHGRLDIPPFF